MHTNPTIISTRTLATVRRQNISACNASIQSRTVPPLVVLWG